jgi:F0F1-type ATP synthase membrane subunit b/b'
MLDINFTFIIVALSFLLFVKLFDVLFWKRIAQVKLDRELELKQQEDQALVANSKMQSIIENVRGEIQSIRKTEDELIDKLLKDFSAQKESEEKQLCSEINELKKKTYSEILEQYNSLDVEIDKISGKLAENIIQTIAPELKSPERIGK